MSRLATWIGDLVRAVGGRGFVFGVFAFLISGVLLWFGKLDGEQWVDYNIWIGAAFLGAKAVEGAAERIRG